MPEREAAEWHCGNCGGLNVDEDTACASCDASRPVEQFVAIPRIDETDESDGRLLSLIARASLVVGVTASVYTAIAVGGPCGYRHVRPTCGGDFNLWLNSSEDWLWYALPALVIPTQISAIAFAVLYRRRRRARPNLNNARIRLGRILGIVGGFVTAVGVFLQWIGAHVLFGGDSLAVFVLGILGLEFVAIPTKGTATMGVIWGIIALLATLVNIIPALGSLGITTFDFGFYVTILGSLVLIVGSSACALRGRLNSGD